MGAIITALAMFLQAGGAARFLATKFVLVALFTLVLPIVLFNVSIELTTAVYHWITAHLPVPPTVQTFTGLAGWLLATAHIPEAVSIIVSSMAGRFVISAAVRV